MSDIKNLYNNLTNFYNVNDENFKEFMAKMYEEMLANHRDIKYVQEHLTEEIEKKLEEYLVEGKFNINIRQKVEEFLNNSQVIYKIHKKLDIHDKEIDKLNTELNSKVSKTEVFNMGNMGQDIREAMTGGSVAVVGKNSVGKENVKFSSLDIFKTNFVKCGNNLLNRNDLTNGFLKNDGTITISAQYKTTNIIPTNGAAHITLARTNTTTTTLNDARDIRFAVFYDSSVQPITASFYDNASNTAESVPIPSSASYVRVSFQAGYDDGHTMIYFGENRKYGYYEDYHEIIDNMAFSDKTKKLIQDNIRKYILENNIIDLDSLNFVEKIGTNLWNNERYTQGYLNNNGTIADSTGYLTSDYILIKGSRITAFDYSTSPSTKSYIRKISYYDENLNPMVDIFYDNGTKAKESIDLNRKATYFKMTIGAELNNNIMVVYGEQAPAEYQGYKYKIKNILNGSSESNTLENKKLFNFGDSIAAGDGNNGKGYAELLGEKYGLRVTDYAKGGATIGSSTTNNIPTQVDNAIASGNTPDYILIEGGTNDIVNSVSLGTVTTYFGISNFDKNTTSGGLEYCLYKLKEAFPDAKIVFVSVHKMASRDYTKQTECQKRCIEICEKWGVPVADIGRKGNLNTLMSSMHKYTNPTTANPNGDKTHPNQLGYEKFYLPIIYNILKSI